MATKNNNFPTQGQGPTGQEGWPVGIASGDLVIAGVLYTVKQTGITASALGDTQVVAAVASKQIRVLALVFAVAAAVSVGWKSAANVLIAPMSFSATGGMEVNRMPWGYVMQTNAGEALNVNLSVAIAVNGSLCYIEV